jgi:hypothetical protein
MSGLRIEIDGDRRAFKPRDTLAGRVSWDVARAMSAELRLFWFTRGKGTEDVGLVESLAFADTRATDQRQFRFILPREPYSVSGTLLSIVWALELIVEPGSEVERREFVLSPTEREIVILR